MQLTPAKKRSGYTLIELTVVIALIGMMTLALIGSFSNNTDIEAFSGNVNRIVDDISRSQVSSYTVNFETTCSNLASECYQRGIAHEYDVSSNSLTIVDLYGEDVLRVRHEGEEYGGIISKKVRRTIDFASRGMELTGITYTNGVSTSNPNQSSIAFLAPAGTAYTRDSIWTGSGSSPYQERGVVTLIFEDEATDLTAEVTYEAESGTINTTID